MEDPIRGAELKIRLVMNAKNLPPGRSRNTIADLRGSTIPDETERWMPVRRDPLKIKHRRLCLVNPLQPSHLKAVVSLVPLVAPVCLASRLSEGPPTAAPDEPMDES
ncbi:hypothetical protein HPB47_001397 [Ixodes persulcatus]|uniref:Uncharacterized protein n=1 Tax=Ixodes persulcatus TaxID=34615 RepID=A0AC60PP40_IXOPE|nr:hypothetical protein HPB47_001397 [Ixodes persulcatus]